MYELPPNDPMDDMLKFLEKTNHPNILHVVEKHVTEDSVYYVTELPKPTLLKHQSLLPAKHFEIEEAYQIFGQLLVALLEMHRLGYLYLSCKPDSTKYEDQQIKLCNFSNLLKMSKASKVK